MHNEDLPDGYEAREAIISAHFTHQISAKTAAERLASLMFEEDEDLETALSLTWASVMIIAHASPGNLKQLASVVVSIAELPPPEDENLRTIDEARVWSDLLGLGMDLNYEWNALEIPAEPPKRKQTIERFVNVDKLVALLVKSGHASFANFDLFAVWTMRAALETPLARTEFDPADVFLPAAAVWADVLSREMYTWDAEFPFGDRMGDPGAGGPLWSGQHGPCGARWQFWRYRFGELAHSNELSDELRSIAKAAEAKMAEDETSLAVNGTGNFQGLE